MKKHPSRRVRKQFTKRVKIIKEGIQRCRWPHNHLFIIALLSIIFYLLVEVALRIYNLYKDIPIVDIPSHFVGGIALGFIAYWALSLTDIWHKSSFTILLTFLGAGIWEVLETLQELVFYNPPYLVDIFWWDGFWDVLVTILGGFITLVIVSYLKNRKLI